MNKKESDALEVKIEELAEKYPGVSSAKLTRIAVMMYNYGKEWQRNHNETNIKKKVKAIVTDQESLFYGNIIDIEIREEKRYFMPSDSEYFRKDQIKILKE